MSIKVSPPPATLSRVALHHAGLMSTSVGDRSLIVPDNSQNQVYGGAYDTTSIVTSSNSISSCFGAGGPQLVDFNIAGSGTASNLDILKQINLQFSVTNSGANAIALLPVWYAFQSIELLIAGATVINVNYPQQLEQNMTECCGKREFESNYSLWGYANSTFTTTSISLASGATRIFQMPLHFIFQQLLRVPLRAVDDQITLRFYVQPANGWCTSTSVAPALTCNSMRVILEGVNLDGVASQYLRDITRASTLRVPMIFPQARPLTIGALAGSFSGPILSNLQGAVATIRLWLYDEPPATSEDRLDTTTFTAWQFLSATGSPVSVGNYYIYESASQYAHEFGSYMRVAPMSIVSGIAAASTLVWPDEGPFISFCDKAPLVLSNDMRMSNYSCSGYEQFTIQGTFTNGQALAFYNVLGFLTVQNGKVVLEFQTV